MSFLNKTNFKMIKQNSQNPILKSFSVHIQSAMKNLKF